MCYFYEALNLITLIRLLKTNCKIDRGELSLVKGATGLGSIIIYSSIFHFIQYDCNLNQGLLRIY